MHKTLIDEYNTIKYNKHKERGDTVLYNILHILSKFSLMFFVYILLIALSITWISDNPLCVILVTLIYFLLIKYKIIEFDSYWLDRK